MVLLEPCTSAFTAKDVTSFIMNRIVRLGWRPERLTSDHDLRIIGEAGQQLAGFLGARITSTPPHHHQANPVERHVQVVQRVLRAMSTTRSGLWDEEALPAVELAINSSVSVATGMTPFDAIFIDSPRMVDSLLRGDEHSGVGDWAERFRLARARLSEARTRITAERVCQKEGYDGRHGPLPTLSPGSSVWIRLRDRPVRSAPSGKLDPVRLGPFVVRRVLSAHRVLVDVPPELNIEDEFDVSQLEPHPSGSDPFAEERESDSAAPSTSAFAPRPAPVVVEPDPPAASRPLCGSPSSWSTATPASARHPRSDVRSQRASPGPIHSAPPSVRRRFRRPDCSGEDC